MNRKTAKKILAAFLLGTVAVSVPVTSDAQRLHDPKVATKSDVRDWRLTPEEAAIVAPEGDNYYFTELELEQIRENNTLQQIPEPAATQQMQVPAVTANDTSIIGQPVATQEQCVNYLLAHNPSPRLTVTPQEVVAYYYEEGMREGIRPDLAFAQALIETGFFRYGGDVVPEQNNYCGLGTTGGGVRGLYFPSSQIGVRAHIQHLLAYTSTRTPTTAIVDPRYNLVRSRYGSTTFSQVQDLNGRWALPGTTYSNSIMKTLREIVVQ